VFLEKNQATLLRREEQKQTASITNAPGFFLEALKKKSILQKNVSERAAKAILRPRSTLQKEGKEKWALPKKPSDMHSRSEAAACLRPFGQLFLPTQPA
jgi:hypothetical protein